MSEAVEKIVEAAIALIAAVVAAGSPFVVAWFSRWMKATFTEKQLSVAKTIAEHSVMVAEELGNHTGATGASKLAIAAETFRSLSDGFKDLGKLDQQKVYDLIHSALLELRLVTGELTSPVASEISTPSPPSETGVVEESATGTDREGGYPG